MLKNISRNKDLRKKLGLKARLACISGLDYLSVIPDRSWIDNGPGAEPRFEDPALSARLYGEISQSVPMNMHCLGLSIRSADVFDGDIWRGLRNGVNVTSAHG